MSIPHPPTLSATSIQDGASAWSPDGPLGVPHTYTLSATSIQQGPTPWSSDVPLNVANSSGVIQTPSDPPPPMDGGLQAWCTVLGGWMASFVVWGYASSFGVYQDYYTRAGTSNPSNISWIGSVHLFFFFFMGLPAGKLLDKGYFRSVVFTGSFLYAFSLFMLSLAHPNKYYQLFLAQGVGMGIGSGLIYLPSIAVQAHHWRARRALAMGIVTTGSSFGGIVYPIMLNHFFHGKVGFAWGVRASAFLSFAILASSSILMVPRPQLSHGPKSSPYKLSVRDILTDPPYIAVVLGICLIVWGLFFPYFYLQLFTVLHGLPADFAFDTLTIQNAASVIGRILPNVFADNYGVLNVLLSMTLGTGAVIFGLFGKATIPHLTVFCILYGFFSGAVLSLLGPMLAALSRDMRELGIRMGIAFCAIAFAFLTGPPIDGAFLNDDYPWWKPIVFSGTVILAAIPLFLFARLRLTQRKGSHRV